MVLCIRLPSHRCHAWDGTGASLSLPGKRVPWPGQALAAAPPHGARFSLTLLSLLFPPIGCRPGCLACAGAFFLLIVTRHLDSCSNANRDAGTNPGDAISAAPPSLLRPPLLLCLFLKLAPPSPRPACARITDVRGGPPNRSPQEALDAASPSLALPLRALACFVGWPCLLLTAQ